MLQSATLCTCEITRKMEHEQVYDEMIEVHSFLMFWDVLEVDISLFSVSKNTIKSLKGMLEDAWP